MSFWGNLFNQVNPFDHGKTFSNPNPAPQPQQAPRPQVNISQLMQSLQRAQSNTAPPQSVNRFFEPPQVQQPGFNPINMIKSVPQAFGINSGIDATRFLTSDISKNIADLTHNKIAAQHAQAAKDAAVNRLSGNVHNILPVAIAEGVKPFAQSVATAGLSGYADKLAKQEADRATRLLTPAYEKQAQAFGYPKGFGASLAEQEAGKIYQNFLQSELAKAGISPTDSGGQIFRKVGGQAVQAGTNILMAGELPAVGGSLAKAVPTFGGLSALQAIGGVAQQDNPTGRDYLTQGFQAGLQGAALPIAFHGAAAGLRGIGNAIDNIPGVYAAGHEPVPGEVPQVGKTVETATPPPQAKVPVGNTPENVAPSANTAFENAQVAPRSSIIDRFKNMLNPVAKFGEAGKQALSSFQSKLGDLASSLQGVKAQSALREDVFNRMSQQEQLKFINDMQHGVPQPTPQLQAIADQYTKFNQQGAQVAKQINPNFKEMANYFTQSGLMSKADASTLAQKWMDKSNTPGSLKQRQFPSVQEAVQFAVDNGVKLKETNPEKLFIHNHEAVLTSAKMKEFQAEQAKADVNPEITQKIIDRYSESGLRGSATFQDYRKASGSLNSVQLFGGFHVLKSTFEKINNDVSVLANEVLKGHPIAAAKDFGHQLVENAKGFGYLQGRGLREDMANGVQNKYTDAAKQANFNTTTDPRYAINGITQSLNDITSGHFGQAAGGVLKAPFRLMNTMMKPIMSHYVVNLKNSAFMNHVDAIDHANPNISPEAKARLYQEAGNTVDGIMGQMNQDNLFWSKTGKDIMSVLMRSPAYNIGTVQQVGGGLKDLLVPHPIRGLKGEGSVLPDSLQKLSTGQGLSTRSAYTLAMTGTTMTVGAMMTYMFTGKGPTDKLDYFYPPTGKTDKNGNKERVSLPSYTKDMFSLANNPGQTVINKAAPGLNIGASIATNKDFKGDMIRNTTGQDSLATQAGQIGNYLKTNAQPFSISSANNRVDKGLGAKVESAFGLPVAPGYITKSGFQKTVEGSLNSALGHNPQTPEQQALATAKSTAKQQAAGGDNSQIDALVKSGQITQKQGDNLKLSSTQTSVQNQFNYLLKVDKVAAGKAMAKASPADIAKLNPSDITKAQDALVIDNAKKGNAGNFKVTGNTSQPTPTLSSSDITPLPSGKFNVNINGTDKTFSNKSQAQTAIDYQNFQDSGKNFATSSDGNTVFRVTNGNPSQMTKTAFDYQVGSATLVDRKNAGDLNGWMKTAQSQIDSIKTQLQDPSVDPLDKLKLQNEATAIMTDATKYQSYGGFTKGRSGNGARIALAGIPKVPTVKTRSAPKIKVAKTKTTKFASVKFAKPRRIKVK